MTELTSAVGMDDLFKGRQFDREIIILCVRWYLRFKLSFRDLVEMMGERGISLAHTTIMRWIQRYVPEFEKRWSRFARPAGRSWRVDETYVKIKGRWTYLYRAVDKEGKTVDFLLCAKRDVAAAKAFFRQAFGRQGRLPHKITLDGYQASHRAAKEVLGEHSEAERSKLRSSKYLNNLIEQDHRSIKLRLGPMLGFKQFRRAATTIAGNRTHASDQEGPVQPREASRPRQNHARNLERSSRRMNRIKLPSACLPRPP
jgi:transposase-like protein